MIFGLLAIAIIVGLWVFLALLLPAALALFFYRKTHSIPKAFTFSVVISFIVQVVSLGTLYSLNLFIKEFAK